MEKAREIQKNNCFIDYCKAFGCVDHNKLWEILKEMGIPEHLTCILRNLNEGQEATFRTGHGTTDWFQTGKGVSQGCILSPCLFNLYAEYITPNARLDEFQARIKTTGKTIALTRWTFVGKVMSLLFNMLSRLVIIFLPRSKHLLISWLQSPSSVILEPRKIKSASFHCFPIYLP